MNKQIIYAFLAFAFTVLSTISYRTESKTQTEPKPSSGFPPIERSTPNLDPKDTGAVDMDEERRLEMQRDQLGKDKMPPWVNEEYKAPGTVAPPPPRP